MKGEWDRCQDWNQRGLHTAIYPSAGAKSYPPDHPKTLAAEAVQDKLLAAAAALVEETHGADSAVARRFQQQLPGFAAAPVRVFSCKDADVDGFCLLSGFAVWDKTDVFTLAHELAHLLLRHPTEMLLLHHCSPSILWNHAAAAFACLRPLNWSYLAARAVLCCACYSHMCQDTTEEGG